MRDNMTVTGYINKIDGIKITDSCNKISSKIWDFCITEKLRISGANIEGAFKKEDNKQSEILDDVTER